MSRFKVKEYLVDYCINYREKTEKGRTIYKLKECLFDSSHVNGHAGIIQDKDMGNISYYCFHDSCSGYKWKDAKKKISGNDKLSKYWDNKNSTPKSVTKADREGIGYISFEEIRETNIKSNPIIGNMLYEGDQTIIHGLGGAGKSLLSQNLSKHLGCADEQDAPKKLWGEFTISQSRKVLFIQAENSMSSMHQRIKAMCDGNEVFKKGLKNLFSVSRHNDVMLTGESFSDENFCQWLIDYIRNLENEQKIKLDIIVIDPLISYHNGDENDANQIRSALDGITNVCLQTKVTPIVVHHDNKKGSLRGSSAIWDWGRNIIGLKEQPVSEQGRTAAKGNNYLKTKKREFPCIRVSHDKCNNNRRFYDFFLKIDENMNFQFVDDSLSPTMQEKCQKVAKALKDMGGEADSGNSLVKAYSEMSGLGLTTCRKHVAKAAEYGFIRRLGNKSGKQKQAYKYKSIK